jgi:hypothetical protein
MSYPFKMKSFDSSDDDFDPIVSFLFSSDKDKKKKKKDKKNKDKNDISSKS